MRNRTGSMAVSMVVVVVLAIGAGASLFQSQSGARLKKRVEVGKTVDGFAHAAVEEVVAKIVNGTAAFQTPEGGAGVVTEVVPTITAEFGDSQGVEISAVKVLGRVLQPPAAVDPAARQRFEELITAGANFAPPAVREAATGDRFGDYRVDNRPEWADHAALAHLTAPPVGAGKAFLDAYWEDAAAAAESETQSESRKAFAVIEPLAPLANEWMTDDQAFLTERHTDDELTKFKNELEGALAVAGEEAAGNQDAGGGGCGGGDAAAGGAESDAGSTIINGGSDAGSTATDGGSTATDGGSTATDGGSTATDGGSTATDGGVTLTGDPVNDIDQLAEDAGIKQETVKLLTLQGEATTTVAGIRVQKKISEYRMVHSTESTKLLQGLAPSIPPHLIAYYNLTPKDLELLGYVGPLDPDGDGAPDPLTPQVKAILAPLDETVPGGSLQMAAFPAGVRR